jgi:hypothetical protein
VGQQPYTAESQLEAFGGAGPGAASKAAAAAMAAQLGHTTTAFAVSTLGKMHGMGGNKAWVSFGGGAALSEGCTASCNADWGGGCMYFWVRGGFGLKVPP